MNIMFANPYKPDVENTHEDICVLLHGIFGMSSNLLSVAKVVAPVLKPVVFDLPNHGQSPTLNPCGFVDMAKMLDRSIEAHKPNANSKVHLIGHSLGGKLVMTYALLYPEKVASIIIMDIVPVDYPPYHADVISAFNEIAQSKPNNRKEATEMLMRYLDEADGDMANFLVKNVEFENGAYKGLQLRMKELEEHYGVLRSFPHKELEGRSYNGPALFMKAEFSVYFEDKNIFTIDSYFPGWELDLIEKSTHNIHIENPVDTKSSILDFYRQIL